MTRLRTSFPLRLLACLAGVVALSRGDAHAGFIVDPAGGTTLFSGAVDGYDDEGATRALGFRFDFYGVSYTSLFATTNGNLNAGGSIEFDNNTFPANNGLPMIAPLWDDLYVYDRTSAIISDISTSNYYALTAQNTQRINNSSDSLTYQTVLFGADTTIGSFDFLAGDIAFGYVTLSSPDLSATVGLNAGDGRRSAVAPGTVGGAVNSPNLSALPTDNRFLLFRPQVGEGPGDYVASVESLDGPALATPVPATALVAVVSAAGLGLVRRRRA